MANELIFDSGAALDRMNGDWDLFLQVAQVLIEDAAGLLDELRRAVACGDAAQIARLAHCLKGSVSNVSALSVGEAALRLEQLARRRDLTDARQCLDLVERQVALLIPEMTAVIAARQCATQPTGAQL